MLKLWNYSYFLGFSTVFEVLGSLKSTKKLSKRQLKRLGGLFMGLGGLLLSMLEAKGMLRGCEVVPAPASVGPELSGGMSLLLSKCESI